MTDKDRTDEKATEDERDPHSWGIGELADGTISRVDPNSPEAKRRMALFHARMAKEKAEGKAPEGDE